MTEGQERRIYRDSFASGYKYANIKLGQSDLYIASKRDVNAAAFRALASVRKDIEDEIACNPAFLTSFDPLPGRFGAPRAVLRMYNAAMAAGVGPMAAVAGAVAEEMARRLFAEHEDVVIENGGDIFMRGGERICSIFAGKSPMSMKLGFCMPAGEWGICTSAGTVGPSVSLGKADAAVVISHDAALSDAAATALGNMVRSEADLQRAVERIMHIEGIAGAAAIIGDRIAVMGQFELVPTGKF